MEDLRRFLLASGASVQLALTVDAASLNSIETNVPCARLIGLPSDLDPSAWVKYTRLYCAYLVAREALAAPCTVFVAVPDAPELEVCLLRLDRAGRVRLLH